MGGLKEHAGLPVLQPVPCLSRSCVGGEGHGRLVCKHTWSIGCCATWSPSGTFIVQKMAITSPIPIF